ncbi:uncharacterized protein LOC125940049 [Dermacentor silvarum]|uniref:uncharacterized protein LOC125940049 n=1 Tax=Dermacentor silvarum TaxID=543639 RepID=UPI002101240B|nr:uncharacterized protein LOC125940049 [Dermacentor silvarum]
MTADRIEYKPNRKVVYTWNLLSVRGSKRDKYNVAYYPGPTQDTVFAIVNHEWKHPFLAKLHYTNNKNCVVANLPYKGQVCVLWVPRAYASSFPQECVDQFEDICYVEVPAYREGLCDYARGDY